MSVQNRHRPWSSQKQTPLTLKCNTMMWAIRVAPGVMTVTGPHLQGNNFLDGHLHIHTTAKLPNLYALYVLLFQPTSSQQFIVPQWTSNQPCWWYFLQFVWLRSKHCRCLSIWLLTNNLHSRLLHNSILVFTYQENFLPRNISLKFHNVTVLS